MGVGCPSRSSSDPAYTARCAAREWRVGLLCTTRAFCVDTSKLISESESSPELLAAAEQCSSTLSESEGSEAPWRCCLKAADI
eukprot:618344-Prymnesium_polylepis.2